MNETGLLHFCFTLSELRGSLKFLTLQLHHPFPRNSAEIKAFRNDIARYRCSIAQHRRYMISILETQSWCNDPSDIKLWIAIGNSQTDCLNRGGVQPRPLPLTHPRRSSTRSAKDDCKKSQAVSASFVISCRTKIVRLTCQRFFPTNLRPLRARKKELLLTRLS